jgi:glycine/D-amino acid oxidase-like deaminating enzyme/nitrite reductase/ring-hydroxylating ferredoxin subunit
MTSFWLDTDPVPERGAPLQPGQKYDVAVVGAGLTGLTTAVLLAAAGLRACVIEARSVGAVATGNTTAKLSLLQGTILSTLLRRHGEDAVRAYVRANLAGQEWLLSFLAARGLAAEQRDALTYANADGGLRTLEAELDASVAAGLPVEWAEDIGLPYAVAGAIRLPGQAQLHPTEVLDALLDEFLAHGGALHTGCRVRDVDVDGGCRVSTSAGEVRVERVVLATGTPILDRGGHFARLRAERSYALAFRVPGTLPQGMYLSLDSPPRSLRTAMGPAGEVLLVGGNGHPVGRHDSPRQLVEDLEAWTGRHFPGAKRTHAWSAQDYAPATGMPLVGALPWSGGRVFVATGYHKWGMTNGVAAGLRLAGALTGGLPDWAGELDAASGPGGWLEAAKANLEVAGSAASGWLGAEARSLPDEVAEGAGAVGRLGALPAARSTVAGRTCTVSAVCTHLGGILAWNDAELSWDCPLHGSRFDASGQVLEGPATADLEQLTAP